jgi:hypothetical protein
MYRIGFWLARQLISHLPLFVFLKACIAFYSPNIYSPPPTIDATLPRRRPWIRAATNNQGLLKCLAQAIERQKCLFPSDALRAEYDLIIGITTIVEALPLTIHWEHVQDTNMRSFPSTNLLGWSSSAFGLTNWSQLD